MNPAMQIMGMSVVSAGGLASSIVEMRAVFRAAILANASSIICAHNHPTGNPEPSADDIKTTECLVKSGKFLGIPIRDHLIITDDGYTSLAERGII